MSAGVCLAQPDLRLNQEPGKGRNWRQVGQRDGAMRALHEQFEGRRQDLTLRLSQRRLELAQMLQKDDADKAAVRIKVQEIMDLERQRQELFVDEYFEARSKLSPAQWNAFRRRVLRSMIGGGSGAGRRIKRSNVTPSEDNN